MPTTIDADTHIDETFETWEYLLPSEQEIKPTVAYPPNPDPNRPLSRYWMIDGERQPWKTRFDHLTRTTIEGRELLDVRVRLHDMDARNVQTHVMYPTMFLTQPTAKPEIDLALKRSYNRWLGHKCIESGGRLRWMCLPPVMTMPEAIQELRWAKDNGAVGIYKKGNEEAGRNISDPYFDALWQEANNLDFAVCFHTGSGIPNLRANRGATNIGTSRVPFASIPETFTSLIFNKLPQRFPKIRWGFIEADAGWIPYELYRIERRLNHPGEGGRLESLLTWEDLPAGFSIQRDAMKEFNLFVTCLVDEDLPYILKFAGEDNLVVGSDYCHADHSSEPDFQDVLWARAREEEITSSAVTRMLHDNPKRLYGL